MGACSVPARWQDRDDDGETALEPLSPREIQARVRAGDSAETIAAENDWPLDRVQRYAEPPLAERAFVAERAQQVELRRTGGRVRLVESVALVVGDEVGRSIRWDAYRRDDGRWVVTASLPAGSGRTAASWTYDPAGPNLHPLDEPARWLMGVSEEPIIDFITERPEAPVAPEPEVGRPHLIAVPSIEEAPEPEPEPDVAAEIAIEPEIDSDIAQPAGQAVSGQPPDADDLSPGSHGQTALPVAPEPSQGGRKPKPKSRRASVPSWDEILFGATRGDES